MCRADWLALVLVLVAGGSLLAARLLLGFGRQP
jgi:hypothetical protein